MAKPTQPPPKTNIENQTKRKTMSIQTIPSATLWSLTTEQFNNWRRQNDYPEIYKLLKSKLPKFDEWLNSQKLTKEIIFQHGIARFISHDSELALSTSAINRGHHLHDKETIDKNPHLKSSSVNASITMYTPYLLWLRSTKGEEIYYKTQSELRITGWYGGKPAFMGGVYLTMLGGCTLQAPILSGRLLDFTCLDDLNIIGGISNTHLYIWHSSAIGLNIQGGLDFLSFHKTALWQHGYGTQKKELTLRDGIFYDLKFKHCELRLHIERSTLRQFRFEGHSFEATLEHTTITKSEFIFCHSEWSNINNKTEFYENIKTMYSSIGKIAEAGEFFYREKVSEMLSHLTPSTTYRDSWRNLSLFKKITTRFKSAAKFTAMFANWMIWGFGERPANSIFLSILLIAASAGVYLTNKASVTFNDLASSIYFSIVTFVTLGYGDISQKTDFLRIFSGLEAFCGMVLMGIFLAGYASKSKQY